MNTKIENYSFYFYSTLRPNTGAPPPPLPGYTLPCRSLGAVWRKSWAKRVSKIFWLLHVCATELQQALRLNCSPTVHRSLQSSVEPEHSDSPASTSAAQCKVRNVRSVDIFLTSSRETILLPVHCSTDWVLSRQSQGVRQGYQLSYKLVLH